MKFLLLNLVAMGLFYSQGILASNYIKVAAPVVKVNSFQAVGPQGSELGEVCGTVTGANGVNVNLKVMADYNSNDPGEYHTFAGPSGNFCELIHTVYGSVEVTLLDPSSSTTKAFASFSKR